MKWLKADLWKLLRSSRWVQGWRFWGFLALSSTINVHAHWVLKVGSSSLRCIILIILYDDICCKVVSLFAHYTVYLFIYVYNVSLFKILLRMCTSTHMFVRFSRYVDVYVSTLRCVCIYAGVEQRGNTCCSKNDWFIPTSQQGIVMASFSVGFISYMGSPKPFLLFCGYFFKQTLSCG